MKTISLDRLIEILEALKLKGVSTVSLEGTLMAPQDGNYIIATTKEQH